MGKITMYNIQVQSISLKLKYLTFKNILKMQLNIKKINTFNFKYILII